MNDFNLDALKVVDPVSGELFSMSFHREGSLRLPIGHPLLEPLPFGFRVYLGQSDLDNSGVFFSQTPRNRVIYLTAISQVFSLDIEASYCIREPLFVDRSIPDRDDYVLANSITTPDYTYNLNGHHDAALTNNTTIEKRKWCPPEGLSLFLATQARRVLGDPNPPGDFLNSAPENAYLVMFCKDTGQLYVPPLGNIWSDGRLCLGADGTSALSRSSIFDSIPVVLSSINRTRYNGDIRPSASAIVAFTSWDWQGRQIDFYSKDPSLVNTLSVFSTEDMIKPFQAYLKAFNFLKRS